jgi:hypothetical protein
MFKKTHKKTISANEKARASFESLSKKSSDKDTYMDPLYNTEMPSDEEMTAEHPEDTREASIDDALNSVLDLVDAGEYPDAAFSKILDRDFLEEWGISDTERRDMKDYVYRYAKEHSVGAIKRMK